MKRIKILLLLFFLATIFSVDASSMKPWSRHHNPKPGCPPVKVPLDGGLLTVLGVAGVAYYTARKKGKKPES